MREIIGQETLKHTKIKEKWKYILEFNIQIKDWTQKSLKRNHIPRSEFKMDTQKAFVKRNRKNQNSNKRREGEGDRKWRSKW